MFLEVLAESIVNQFVDIVTIILLALFVAVLLNQKMIGRAAFRAIFFVPVVIGAGIIAEIDAAGNNTILEAMSNGEMIDTGAIQGNAMTGLVNAMDISRLFSNLGIGTGLVEIVVGLVESIYDIVNRSGVQILIFLSGLQSISPSIYESCQMEGATGWETFWKITFPMISPMILVNAVYTVIDSFTAESNVVMKFIANKYNESNVVSSAMAWVYFLVIIVIIAVVAALLSSFVFYQRKE